MLLHFALITGCWACNVQTVTFYIRDGNQLKSSTLWSDWKLSGSQHARGENQLRRSFQVWTFQRCVVMSNFHSLAHSKKILRRCGDCVCFWGMQSPQRWASTADSQWRYMSSPVQHFPSYENQLVHRLRFNLLPFSNASPPRWFCGKHCPCGFCGCWRVQRPWRKPVSMHLYLRSVKPQRAFIFNCGLLQVHWLCHREVGAWFCAIPCGKKEFNIVSIFNPDWLENIAS